MAQERPLRDQHPDQSASQMPKTDADLVVALTFDFSPVCTWCYWWKPSDGHYCGAWPPPGVGGRGRTRIPDAIWRGENYHLRPVGGEKTDDHGQPIVFKPDPDTPHTSDNAALLAAYDHEQQQQRHN